MSFVNGIELNRLFCRRVYFIALLVFFSLLTSLAFAADSTGTVLVAVKGVWLKRDGKKLPVAVHDTVMVSDSILTDSTGKAQILFNDDTIIAIGSNSSVTVADFVFGADKPASFTAKMTRGVARFVTGKIVEQNRAGFSVQTPRATVGIRGTTFAVEISASGITEITGLSINPDFPVTVTNTKTGAVDLIDKSGLAVRAAPVGNTRYLVPAGKFSSISEAVEITPAGQPVTGTDDGGQSEGQTQKNSAASKGKPSKAASGSQSSEEDSSNSESTDSDSSGQSGNSDGASGNTSGTSSLGSASEQGRLSLAGSGTAGAGSASGNALGPAGTMSNNGAVLPASVMCLVASVASPRG